MLNRVIQFGLAALAATALAGINTVEAQDDFGDPVEDDGLGDDGFDDDGFGDDGLGDDGLGDDGLGDDGMVEPPAGDDMGAEAGGNPHALAAGQIQIDAVVELNLSTDAVAKPFSIAPDVWYGVSDKLRVGLVHSAYGTSSWWVGVGNGLCLAGEENGCADVYDGLGLRALFGLSESPTMSLAADGGVLVKSFDPMALAVRLGVKGAFTSGKIMVGFNPAVDIGVTERDALIASGFTVGNKEVINVPVDVGFMATPQLWAGVQTGLMSPIEDIGDFYLIALNVGAMFMVNEQLMVGGTFGFPAIAGGPDGTGADTRALNIFAGYKI